MKTVKDSSEIHEAARLFYELSRPVNASPVLQLSPDDADAFEGSAEWLRMSALVEDQESKGKGRKMEEAVISLCQRGSFFGGVITDGENLPTAWFHSPTTPKAVAAVTKVYGETLETVESLCGDGRMGGFSLSISQVDKAVARRFVVNNQRHTLIVFCPKEVDERIEVESSVGHLISLIAHERLVSR